MSHLKIDQKKIEKYTIFLKESYRPPSKGGNANALHSHVLEIEGVKYSFLALGSQRWVFKTDTASFDYEIKNGYKNITVETIATLDRNGKSVVRGNRGYKDQLRTAQARLPSSRREQRD